MPSARRIGKLVAAALAGAVVVAALARWGGELARLLRDRSGLEAWLRGLGVIAPAAAVVLMALKSIVLVLPGQLVSLAIGWVFGFGVGALCTYLGMMGGSAVAMLLARRFGRPLVARIVPERSLREIDALARRRGGSFFALVFLLPFTPDDMACWALGLTPLPLGRMFVIAAGTRLPAALISAWLGAHAGRLSHQGWIVTGLLIALLLVLYVAARGRIDTVLWRWLRTDGDEPG
jgi:uncharacterized membrane protein YdjX (TVP38/TMEM64 family)